MNILITGAAGCVGSKLVEVLLSNQDNKVFATDIKPNPFEDNKNLCYRALDLQSDAFIEWVEEKRPHCVIHLASVLQLSAKITREIAYKIDIEATQRLLKSCIKMEIKKFIITTSGAAYGYYPENKYIIFEDRPTRGNPDYFYSAHKAKVEQIMADYRLLHPELKQIVFRPGAILGPDFSGPVVKLFQQKVVVGLKGYPGWFNFIWSTDVVDYLVEGVYSDITGEFNMSGDGLMSLRHIAMRLNKPYFPVPELLLRAGLTVGKKLGLIEYGPEQIKFIKYRPILDNKKLKTTFKHQPIHSTSQTLDAFLKSQQRKIHEKN